MLILSLAIFAAIVPTVSWTMITAVQLAATTALIMGGSDHPLLPPKDQPPFVTAYMNNAVVNYIEPAAAAGTGTAGDVDNRVAVFNPAEIWPVFGSQTFDVSVAAGRRNLENCLSNDVDNCRVNGNVGSQYPPTENSPIVVFGYSQSALIAVLAKQDLIDNYREGDTKSFVFVANPMRGNGGILMRGKGIPPVPILGVTFHGAAPTNSPVLDDGTFAYPTVDAAQQYDIFGGDAPYRPLNLLALTNSILAYAFLHGRLVDRPLSEAHYQGQLGDTTYYLFEAETLPVLMPLRMLGVPSPILKLFDAPIRVLVEDAYLRDINPGVPTPATLMPIGNPIVLAVKVVASLPVGIDDALQEVDLGRPLGTTPAGPFGVGGPSLPEPPATTEPTKSAVTEQAPIEQDDTESPVAERQSLADNPPSVEPKSVSGNGKDDAEPVEQETGSMDPAEEVTEQQETARRKVHNTSATDPDRPKVRGPIEFDSPAPRPDSPVDDDDDAGDETTSEPAPADAGDQDAGDQDAGDQDAGDQDAGDQDAGDQDAGDQDAA